MVFKKLLQSYASNGIALYTTSLLVPGLVIAKDITVFLIGTLALTVSETIVKPVLKIISIPINLLTMGLFNIVINMGLLYCIVYLINGIEIDDCVINFDFLDKIEFVDLNIFNLDTVMLPWYGTLAVAALLISLINSFIKKLFF